MMPEQPHNQAEEKLKQYAQERRAQGGDFSLHPATRRMLQGEVTRQFGAGRNSGAGKVAWFAAWRGRLAFAAVAVAALGVSAWVYKMGQHDHPVMELADVRKPAMDLFFDAPEKLSRPEVIKEFRARGEVALRDESGAKSWPDPGGARWGEPKPAGAGTGGGLSSPAASVVATYSVSPATAPVSSSLAAPVLVAARVTNSLASANGVMLSLKTDSTAASFNYESTDARRLTELSALTKTDDQVALAGTGRAVGAADRARTPGLSGTLATAPVAPVATASSPTQTRAPQVLSRYYRVAVPSVEDRAAPAASRADAFAKVSAPVLTRFDIEQAGDALRIVDADGSVYDGKIEVETLAESEAAFSASPGADKDPLLREKIVALKKESAARSADYSFRASGSNVTLRQPVVVTGHFTPAANRPASGGGAGDPATAGRRLGFTRGVSDASGVATNEPAAIEGVIRVGASEQQFFRAAPEPRN